MFGVGSRAIKEYDRIRVHPEGADDLGDHPWPGGPRECASKVNALLKASTAPNRFSVIN